MIRQAEGTLVGPCPHPASSLLTHIWATDPDAPSVTVTAARLTASGTTCTMTLNPEAGGIETHQSLPIGRQRNVIFSHYRSFILGLLLLISKLLLLRAMMQNR